MKRDDWVSRQRFPCEFGPDHIYEATYHELSVYIESMCENEDRNYPPEENGNKGAMMPLIKFMVEIAGGNVDKLKKLEAAIKQEMRKAEYESKQS